MNLPVKSYAKNVTMHHFNTIMFQYYCGISHEATFPPTAKYVTTNVVRRIRYYNARTGIVMLHDVPWEFSTQKGSAAAGEKKVQIIRRENAAFGRRNGSRQTKKNWKHGCYKTAPLSYRSSPLDCTNLCATSECCTSELCGRPRVLRACPYAYYRTQVV